MAHGGASRPAIASMDVAQIGNRIHGDAVVIVECEAGRASGPPASVADHRLSLTPATGSTDRFEAMKTFTGLRSCRLL
jgi:hypothetical protein